MDTGSRKNAYNNQTLLIPRYRYIITTTIATTTISKPFYYVKMDDVINDNGCILRLATNIN